MTPSPQSHGHRQFRCEAEQAGRILRGQAERKKQFQIILPLLEEGMIQPKTEKKRAGKNRKAIREALADLRDSSEDGGNVVELQSLIEQACNFYLANGCFPDTYEEMQCAVSAHVKSLSKTGKVESKRPLGQRLTRRGNPMVDKSMSLTRKMGEGMYTIGPHVLRAIGETGTVKPEFLYDELRIRHTMHKVATPEYVSSCIGYGNTPIDNHWWNALSGV